MRKAGRSALVRMLGASVSERSPYGDAVRPDGGLRKCPTGEAGRFSRDRTQHGRRPSRRVGTEGDPTDAFLTDKGTSEMPALRIRAVEVA